MEVLSNQHCNTGENPFWDPESRRLYWVDIPKGILYAYDFAEERTLTLYSGEPVGGFTRQSDGTLLLFRVSDIVRLSPDGSIEAIIRFPDDGALRFNDVIADPEGRVFAGRMAEEDADGGLWRIDLDGTTHRLFTGSRVPNGMGFSLDEKYFYYTCTSSGEIVRFSYDRETGDISDRSLLYKCGDEEGKPDGLTVDTEDCLWSARFNGSRIVRHSPEGDVLKEYPVPVRQVTSLVFGGPQLNRLFITTAGGKENSDKLDGALFSMQTESARGRLEYPSKILL